MRTIVVIAVGLVVLVLAALVGRSAGAVYAFIGAWLLFSIADWYVGVYRAGYSAIEELRIHAVIFAVPALAGLVIIYFRHRR
jgi:hypothetical protein